MPAAAFEAGIARYRRAGFTDFKVKVSGDPGLDEGKVAVLRSAVPDARIRVDANNLWKTAGEALDGLRRLGRVFAVEEPLPADRYADLARLAEALDTSIVLDESARRAEQLSDLPGAPGRWLVNIRVSKMGGLLRSLAVVEAARAAGLRVIVGAQVGETSVLTRAGLTVAQAARDILVAQEGAFGTHLLARDVCESPLMFGAGGVLDAAAHPVLARPGLGIDVVR